MEIGAQFYTVRDFCKNLDDFAESLKKVADIGYKTVQISGTCAYEPQWLAEQLKKNGLRCVLTHTPADGMTSDPARVAANHDVFGCKYVGLGYYQFAGEDPEANYRRFLDTFLPAAKALKEHGKYFMYHNHASEFQKIGGKVVLEKLREDVPADLMGLTLDTFWVQAGGGDPAWWLERLTGRVPCIHLKDYGFDGIRGDKRMEAVGDGNLNFDRIFEKAEAAGTEYMLVEQDDCNGENPFDCLKRSYDFLTAHGFH